MKGFLTALLALSVGSLWFLNFSSGIIGGIWLAFSDGISLVLFGILLVFIMPFAYSIAFLPTLPVLPLIAKTAEGGHRFIVSILSFLLSGYNNFILVMWVTFIFDWIMSGLNSYPTLALLLWGYSVVMGPLGYMASKEDPDSTGTTLGILFAQLAYLIMSVNFLFGSSIENGYLWIWLLFLGFTAFTTWVGFMSVPKKVSEEVRLATIPTIMGQNHSEIICSECGHSNKTKAVYCKNCGKRL